MTAFTAVFVIVTLIMGMLLAGVVAFLFLEWLLWNGH
jgi:hypothetical protein